MFTLNEFSLDVTVFALSVMPASQWYKPCGNVMNISVRKFLCWSVSRLHNEYKLTKCEILLPTKLTKEEPALSFCSASRAI